MTNSTITTAGANRLGARPTTQKVVIVNGSPEILDSFESTLNAGHYDIVFVESNDHAYSQIKRVKPDLVILCVHIEDGAGLQVLSMLKLDNETCEIPVMTYTTAYDAADDAEEEDDDASGAELFPAPKPAFPMN